MRNTPSIIALAAAALFAAGCGSSNNNPSNGSASQSGSNFAAMAVKYAECMRSHGVPGFPEPRISTSNGGSATAVQQVVSGNLAALPQFKSAARACEGFMPGPASESPAQLAAQRRAKQHALLAFAQCLRSHGVPNFPDPSAQGDITPQMLSAAGVDLQGPAILPAARACVGVTHGMITIAQVEQAIQHLSSGATGSTGTGSGQSNGSGG